MEGREGLSAQVSRMCAYAPRSTSTARAGSDKPDPAFDDRALSLWMTHAENYVIDLCVFSRGPRSPVGTLDTMLGGISISWAPPRVQLHHGAILPLRQRDKRSEPEILAGSIIMVAAPRDGLG